MTRGEARKLNPSNVVDTINAKIGKPFHFYRTHYPNIDTLESYDPLVFEPGGLITNQLIEVEPERYSPVQFVQPIRSREFEPQDSGGYWHTFTALKVGEYIIRYRMKQFYTHPNRDLIYEYKIIITT